MAATVLLLALSSLSLTLLLAPAPARAGDPDGLQDFCVAADPAAAGAVIINGLPCKPSAAVTADDFYSQKLVYPGDVTSNPFGANVTSANVASFPGLNTLGISMNRVDFAPGGLNPPHSHPRASELILLVEGQLLVGFISTANVFFSKVLVTPGEVFVVPRGLVHFQYNVGTVKAQAITTFNSQLPGLVLAAPTLFGSKPAIPDDVLEKAFQVDQGLVDQIKAKFGN